MRHVVKNLGPQWIGISGFRGLFFFCFSLVVALTSPAFAAKPGPGSSGQLTVNPSSINFGSVSVGGSQTQAVTLTNPGGSKVSITRATPSGTNFAVSGLSYPVTLSAGQSLTCYLTFDQQSAGAASGSVSIAFSVESKGHGGNISYGSSTSVTVPLSGTGVNAGQLTVNPASLGFGSVTAGSSQTLAETLTNSGGASVTVSTIGATSGFAASGVTLPITLNPGQSVSFNATFSPTSAGAFSGNLAIASNASNSALNVPLSGTGVTLGQLTASPASLSFGSVLVGNTQALAETLTNSGGTSITISAAGATSSFSASGLSVPVTLNPGQSVSFTVAFSPTSAASISGGLAVTSNASNASLNVPLAGTGTTPGQLAASPASLSFGSVPAGTSASLSETLTNSGGSSLTISQITSSGTGFSFSGVTPPLSLAAGQSVTFNVAFAPTSGGSATGSLGITNSANSGVSVSLSGTGALPGQLTVTPSSINFGSIVAGTTQSQTGTLSAGNTAVTVSSVGVSGSQFSANGLSLPVTIAAGSSVSFQLMFAPTTSGSATANVTFVSNASNSPTVESLSGTATAPQHSVALSWSQSTSNDVVGYNIYRGTASGGPYARLASTMDTNTSGTDSTVQGGTTYFYVVTSVDSAGAESSYSGQTQAVIPSP
jgi:hypothetical protein